MSKDIKQKEQESERLIERLYSGENVPDEERQAIRMWILEHWDEEDNFTALREKFIEMYKREENPKYAYELWPALAERLGLDVNLVKIPESGINAEYAPEPDTARLVVRPVRTSRKSLWKGIGLRVAAVLVPVVLIVGAAGVLFKEKAGHTGQPTVHHLTVSADGGHLKITLPDGSTVNIKPGSTLGYAEDFGNNRSVTLDGEAYFTVAKDAEHPFSVDGGDFTVTVLGTEFNIMTSGREGESEVTLASGSVSVTADGIAGTTVMIPGQQLVYNRESRTVEVHDVSEAELMRLQGLGLVFDNTLDEIFRVLERHFGVTIIHDKPAASGLRHSVMFDPEYSLGDVLDILRLLEGFTYTIENDKVQITTY